MSEKIREEALNNASDEVYAIIEASSHFMNKAEWDEFVKRIRNLLDEMTGVLDS